MRKMFSRHTNIINKLGLSSVFLQNIPLFRHIRMVDPPHEYDIYTPVEVVWKIEYRLLNTEYRILNNEF